MCHPSKRPSNYRLKQRRLILDLELIIQSFQQTQLKILQATMPLKPELAYVLGYLHDIGRRNGVSHMGHTIDDMITTLFLVEKEVITIDNYFPWPANKDELIKIGYAGDKRERTEYVL